MKRKNKALQRQKKEEKEQQESQDKAEGKTKAKEKTHNYGGGNKTTGAGNVVSSKGRSGLRRTP